MDRQSAATHVAFADESHWNDGRYRALSLVTMPGEHYANLEVEIRGILSKSSVSEFKWNHLRGADYRIVALKFCGLVVDSACLGHLRLDVLIWDIGDSRHDLHRRDDAANLQRMYYHLFKNVLRRRWPDESVWALHPDENTVLDWDKNRDCLNHASVEVRQDLLAVHSLRMRLKREFRINKVTPVSSACSPLVQVADLFAGLAVFSREHHSVFRNWRDEHEGQTTLFASEAKKMNKSTQEKCRVLYHFLKSCERRGLGVSLDTGKGLWTRIPDNPVNFWPYTPQHPRDKAPTKDDRRRLAR